MSTSNEQAAALARCVTNNYNIIIIRSPKDLSLSPSPATYSMEPHEEVWASDEEEDSDFSLSVEDHYDYSEETRLTFVLPKPALWDEPTHVSHTQCADAVAALEGSLSVLCRERQLAVFDIERGITLLVSPLLPFDVYSLSVEPDLGWVVCGGCERTAEHYNVALLRLQREEGAHQPLALPILRAFAIGRVSPRFGSHDQVNSVRFGCSLQSASAAAPPVRVRVLLVGSQDKSVYCVAVPAPLPDGSLAPGPQALLAKHTFRTAINCACASPDGRWLAAVGDLEEVYVLGSETGFLDAERCTRAGFSYTLRFNDLLLPVRDQAGCQYVVWSGDSARLAVSSDTLNAVAVWSLPQSPLPVSAPAPHCRFTQHQLPCLSLAFLPHSHTLAFAEAGRCIYLADVDACARADAWRRPLTQRLSPYYLRRCGMQLLLLQNNLTTASAHRTTGLCVSAEGHLLVTLRRGLFQFTVLPDWSRAMHMHAPLAFRRATRALLLCAAALPPGAEEPPNLASLPRELVLHIIALAAAPQSAWLPARLDEAKELFHNLVEEEEEEDEEEDYIVI